MVSKKMSRDRYTKKKKNATAYIKNGFLMEECILIIVIVSLKKKRSRGVSMVEKIE